MYSRIFLTKLPKQCIQSNTFAGIYRTGQSNPRFLHMTYSLLDTNNYQFKDKETENLYRNSKDGDYTATESAAEGISSTDDSIPPPRTNHNTVQNEREPAAASTDSAYTLNEVKQFVGNIADRTREMFKGANRTQPQQNKLPDELQDKQPKRSFTQYTDLKEKVKSATKDAKEALRNAANSTSEELSKDWDKAQAKSTTIKGTVDEMKAQVKNSTTSAMKDQFSKAASTAKEAFKKGVPTAGSGVTTNTYEANARAQGIGNSTQGYPREVHSNASDNGRDEAETTRYSNTATETATEAGMNIRQSANNMEGITGAATEPRTDLPRPGPNTNPRTDNPVNGPAITTPITHDKY